MTTKDPQYSRYDLWVQNLEVGDEVVVEQPFTIMPYYLSKVMKITPTGRIRAKGFMSMLFKNGEASSGNMYWYALLEPTQDILDKINFANMRRQLGSIDWGTADDDMVKNVWELICM